jgi:hypothetical protein
VLPVNGVEAGREISVGLEEELDFELECESEDPPVTLGRALATA